MWSMRLISMQFWASIMAPVTYLNSVRSESLKTFLGLAELFWQSIIEKMRKIIYKVKRLQSTLLTSPLSSLKSSHIFKSLIQCGLCSLNWLIDLNCFRFDRNTIFQGHLATKFRKSTDKTPSWMSLFTIVVKPNDNGLRVCHKMQNNSYNINSNSKEPLLNLVPNILDMLIKTGSLVHKIFGHDWNNWIRFSSLSKTIWMWWYK